MHFEKVIFAFFIILALSLNFSFFIGDLDNPEHHHIFELAAALVASLICTVLKFGDRSYFGSTVLASSLVAVLMLIAATTAWFFSDLFATPSSAMATISSLAGGALIANVLSVILLILETSQLRR
jgi:hypothetical protein